MCRATLSLSLTSMSVITLHRCKSVREDILKQQNHLIDPEVTARSFHAPSSFCILLFLFPSLIWPWSLSMKAVLLQPYPHSRGLIFSPCQNPPQRKSLKILFFFFFRDIQQFKVLPCPGDLHFNRNQMLGAKKRNSYRVISGISKQMVHLFGWPEGFSWASGTRWVFSDSVYAEFFQTLLILPSSASLFWL